jgi:hypothetical protein
MIGDHIGRSEHHQHVASPAQANLLNKTAAAAEEFKRLLLAEQEWQEERAQFQQDIAKAIQVGMMCQNRIQSKHFSYCKEAF